MHIAACLVTSVKHLSTLGEDPLSLPAISSFFALFGVGVGWGVGCFSITCVEGLRAKNAVFNL